MRYLIILIVLVIVFRLFRGGRKIVDISKKLPKKGNWPFRDKRVISDITIHHSATPSSHTAFDFANYHVNTKGWQGIGYHFVIPTNGEIQRTNDVTAWSWHNGFNNENAVGICIVGDFTKTSPTRSQLDSCEWLCRELKRSLPIKYINGHKDYTNATSCPASFPVSEMRRKLKLGSRVNIQKKSIGFVVSKYDSLKADN
jgi:N-acetyl-anhydromuramyl-L-alanine amidase AmpD